MGGYFRPWRRKIGFVLLVMALLSCGAWLRSLRTIDSLWFQSITVNSNCGDLIIDRFYDDDVSPLGWDSYDVGAVQVAAPFVDVASLESAQVGSGDVVGIHWQWEYCGFEVKEQGNLPDGPILSRSLTLPYWMLVVPLTLLSAGMLLWPVRRAVRNPVAPAAESV